MADKIKEKAPIRKELKEKVKAAPKEMLRRGLSDGTQRLRGQLRDTAQRGQRDDYGDQIEDAAWRGGRWGERGIEKLLKKKKADRGRLGGTSPSTSSETPAEPPSGDDARPDLPEHPAPTDGTERSRNKTRESVAVRERDIVPSKGDRVGSPPTPAPQDRVEPSRIRTREADCSATGVFPNRAKNIMPSTVERPSERLTIKSKDTNSGRQATMPPEPQAVKQGRQKFQQEQKKKATARRFGERRTVPDSSSMPAIGSDKLPVQHFSPWRQIAQSGDTPAFTKGKTVSPVAPAEKALRSADGVQAAEPQMAWMLSHWTRPVWISCGWCSGI